MSSQQVRILMLEDNPLDAELIERELRRAQLAFCATRVQTEAEFRDSLDSSDPDVILADYNLPDFDGISALHIARLLVPETPFIFVSGSIGEERAIQALKEGATDYVLKDRPSRLAPAITRALLEQRERDLRQRAQQALRVSEERFQHAVRATQELIWDWNVRTGTLWFNQAIFHVWGYDPDTDFTVAWWRDRMHPDDAPAVLSSVTQALEEGQTQWSAQYRFRAADGTYGHLFDRGLIIRDEAGRPSRMIGAAENITQQVRIEQRLRESEHRFRSVAETAHDAIIVVDADGKIIFWNAGASAIFGYDASEIAGRPFTVLAPECARGAYERQIESIRSGLEADDSLLHHLQGMRRDGAILPLEMSRSIWTGGSDVFCTFILRDATRRVRNEQRQRLLLGVTATLIEVLEPGKMISRLVGVIGRALGWDFGAYWRVDSTTGILQCESVWAADHLDQRFLGEWRRAAPRVGQSLLGTVVTSGHPAVVNDPAEYADASRAAIASRHGMRRGVAFPVLETGTVPAVMEFGTTQSVVIDEELVNVLSDLGRRIGESMARRMTENRLHQSEANLAEAQRIARLGSFSYDVERNSLEWSDQTYVILNRGSQHIGESFQSYLTWVYPGDRDRVRALTTPPLAGTSFDFQHRVVDWDGTERVMECRIAVKNGTAADPKVLVGTVQDITDKASAVETIRRLSHQNELLLSSAAEGILGIDAMGRVSVVNPAAVAITGFSVEDFRASSSMHALIHHSKADGQPYPSAECPIHHTLEDGRVRSAQEIFWRKSGEGFHADYSCSPIVENDAIAGAVVIFQDITARLQLERQLEQAHRVSSLGRAAATIAHEFNNVLMGIQPFAEVIRRRSNADDSVRQSADQIIQSVARGKRVTQEILRFTHPADPALQPVVLCDWIRELGPELRALAGPAIEIEFLLPDEVIVVAADTLQLHQVFSNIVLNARDAMDGRGRITIAVTAPEGQQAPDRTMVSVHDTGRGMTAEVLEHVFEPLFTTKRSGTGLGLAVAKQVVERHGGEIHANSAPGKGSSFHIVLRRIAEVGPLQALPQGRGEVTTRRVLLIEDDVMVARGITGLLEMEGIDVRTIRLGAEAVEAVETYQPEAVILDVTLPDEFGTEVFVRLKERWPDLPVIFSTGHADEASLEVHLTKPNVAFLRKPYDLEQLLRILEEVSASPVRKPERGGIAGDLIE